MSDKCPRCALTGLLEETVKDSSEGPQHHNRRCPDPKCNETWKHEAPQFNHIRVKADKEAA